MPDDEKVMDSSFSRLRGKGGSPKKIMIFLLFTYVIALDILFPKWAHLPSNFAQLLRYDPSK